MGRFSGSTSWPGFPGEAGSNVSFFDYFIQHVEAVDGFAVHAYSGTSFFDGLFRRDFLSDMLDTAARGALVLPSPLDGRVLATDRALCLNAAVIAYRFVGNDGTVFYAIAGLWRVTLCALKASRGGL